MQVQLFKKAASWTDKDGKEHKGTNYYLKCGGSLIPIQVRYFEGADGKDQQYASRKSILSAFADELLPKE